MSDEANVSNSKYSPLTVAEVAQIATDLQPWVGAQLQDCLQTSSELGLAFYHLGETIWLWIDLNPQLPLVVRIRAKNPPARKKISRPVSLFLKSRIVGRRIESIHAALDLGRVLVLSFHRAHDEKEELPPQIEIRLYPSGQNIIARDGKKSVAESKPKELPPSQTFTTATAEPRKWEFFEEKWREAQSARNPQVAAAPKDALAIERDWARAIEKKEKALEKMQEEIQRKNSSVFRDAGEWLKANGMPDARDLPAEFKGTVDLHLSLAENLAHCFTKAKDNARKIEGAQARMVLLEAEIAKLKKSGPGIFTKARDQADKKGRENLLSRADARGRKHTIKDDLDVYIGKSAADNLALLRRAQPFDYWLHLRDQPGSHAIIRRTRGRNVTDQEFFEAGRWLIEQSEGKRASELAGERFDMLIVECRYVRPIKGDKLGRVNYTNDRVMSVRL